MARQQIIPIFVPHLGCPNQCVFCDQKRISGSSSSARGGDVTAALEKARAMGVKGAQLAFYGGSFTAVPAQRQEELLEAAAPFIRDGVIASIRLSTRPDAIDAQTLRRLRDHGVTVIELGSQSMDDGVLEACRRGHTAQDTERAAGLIRAAGLGLVLQMMTGLPGSNDEKDKETARRLAALKPDAVRIYPTVIVRGAELEALWRAGEYKEHSVAEAVSLCADILPIFRAAQIPVIRLGLNPTEELSGGEAAAGAYHPALGELVLSELFRRRAMALLAEVPPGAAVRLGVHKSRVSVMTGQRRENLRRIQTEKGLRALSVAAVEAEPEEILLLDVDL